MTLRCCPWTQFCDRIHAKIRHVCATRVKMAKRAILSGKEPQSNALRAQLCATRYLDKVVVPLALWDEAMYGIGEGVCTAQAF